MQVETNADLPPPPTTPEEVAAVEQKWLDEVYKGDSLPELTLQVVIVSVFLGALMIAFNIYMGLKTGWGEGGSLIAEALAVNSGITGVPAVVVDERFLVPGAVDADQYERVLEHVRTERAAD